MSGQTDEKLMQQTNTTINGILPYSYYILYFVNIYKCWIEYTVRTTMKRIINDDDHNDEEEEDGNESSTVEESVNEYDIHHSNDLEYSDDDDDVDDENNNVYTNSSGSYFMDNLPHNQTSFVPSQQKLRTTTNNVTTTTPTNTIIIPIVQTIPHNRYPKTSTSRYTLRFEEDDNDEDDDTSDDPTIHVQQFPPIQSYRNPNTASVPTLWNLQSIMSSPPTTTSTTTAITITTTNTSTSTSRTQSSSQSSPLRSVSLSSSSSSILALQSQQSPPSIQSRRNDAVVSDTVEEDISRLTHLLQQVQMTAKDEMVTPTKTTLIVYDIQKERQQIRNEMEKIQYQLQRQHQQAQKALQTLIHQQEATAEKIRTAMMAQQQQQEQQEEEKKKDREKQQQQQQRRRQVEEEHQRNDEAVTTETTSAATVAAATTQEEDPVLRNTKPESSTSASTPSRVDGTASTSITASSPSSTTGGTTPEPPEDYILRAIKYRTQLIDVERSVAEYDTTTDAFIKQKRLLFKKLVNGKINTLAENVQKIREVAHDVTTAITNAKNDDAQYKSAPNQNNNNKMYALGKRYLVNLLSSKVIVRIQAEGFNGPRGDGFPLAHMLCLVAANVKDMIPVLTAHIYTVCPTAIPTLPSTTDDTNTNTNNSEEDNFMIQLGMIRQKDGNFETFERFLSRTEVCFF